MPRWLAILLLLSVLFVSTPVAQTPSRTLDIYVGPELKPRAAIMNNGPRKGGAVQTFQILAASPGLEDLWQNHYSVPGGSQHNRPEAFIANLDEGARLPGAAADAAPVHVGPASWIKVSASADGGFTINNSRTGMTKRYAPRN